MENTEVKTEEIIEVFQGLSSSDSENEEICENFINTKKVF